MKKVLIIANLGGFVEFLYDDIKLYREMGYDVEYAANDTVSNWDVYKDKLIEMQVPIHHIGFASKNPYSKDNFFAYRQLKTLLKNDYDVIHCHTPIVGILTKIAAKKYRKKGTVVIYTSHGFTFNKSSSKKSWLVYYNLEKMFSKYCDAIITINKEDYENAKKMKCKKVYYIHGVGVNLEKYNSVSINVNEYKKKIGVPDNKTVILSIGELSERKNHCIIIEAISLLPNKDDYIYVICGKGINGGTGEQLEKLAHEKGVNLLLLGFRVDIPEIIHCSDIGALPSIREGLGLAGIQSLTCGVPLVASNVQGIIDYVDNGKNGFLCDASNAIEFAESIKKLSDKKTRESMKENCVRIAKNFSMEISSAERKKIYNELLK